MPKKKIITPDLTEADKAAFETLLAHPGWQKLSIVMGENARLYAEQILNKEDLQGNPLTEVQLDKLRDRRKHLLELIRSPKKYVIALGQTDNPTEYDPSEDDPYPQHIKKRIA